MLLYCLKCKKESTEIKNSRVIKTSNERTMLLSKRAMSDSKNQNLSKKPKQVDC